MHAGPTAAQPPQGLTLEAVAAAAAAAEEEEAKKQPDVGIADRQSLASSLLLRDVHTALLRIQSVQRGWQARRWLSRRQAAARTVQRYVRGWLARLEVGALADDRRAR